MDPNYILDLIEGFRILKNHKLSHFFLFFFFNFLRKLGNYVSNASARYIAQCMHKARIRTKVFIFLVKKFYVRTKFSFIFIYIHTQKI